MEDDAFVAGYQKATDFLKPREEDGASDLEHEGHLARITLSQAPKRVRALLWESQGAMIWCAKCRLIIKNPQIVPTFRKCLCSRPRFARELPPLTNIQLLTRMVGEDPDRAVWCWKCNARVKGAGP